MDLTGFQPLGRFAARGGSGATITGYDPAAGVLSGVCAPNLIVVVSVASVFSTTTVADATGRWSALVGAITGLPIAVAVIPVGVMLYPIAPGGRTYSAAGTYTLNLPGYNNLQIEMVGSGGNGQSNSGITASNGAASTIPALGLSAGGGRGGANSAGGDGGTATGGDTNIPGNNGGQGAGKGGASVGLGAGAGGSGAVDGGGSGAYLLKRYAINQSGAPAPASSLTIVVGAPGSTGASAVAGAAKVTWS